MQDIFMEECEQGPSDASNRAAKLNWLALHLPPLPTEPNKPWVWTEEETTILRSACKVRFDESVRTETLYYIGATAIRIYLGRLLYAEPKDQPSRDSAKSETTDLQG